MWKVIGGIQYHNMVQQVGVNMKWCTDTSVLCNPSEDLGYEPAPTTTTTRCAWKALYFFCTMYKVFKTYKTQ